MAKYTSINMNPKLLRTGGRKAPRITIDELKKHLEDFYKKHVDEDYDPNDYDEDCEPFMELQEYLGDDVYACYMENGWFDNEKAIDYHTLDNGFTFLGVCGGADWSDIMYYILYWDGKKIRGYVPRYGNTVNIDCKGFEEMEGEYWEPEDKHYQKWFKSPAVQALTKDERKLINEINKHSMTTMFNDMWERLANGKRKKKNTDTVPVTGPITFDEFKRLTASLAYRVANEYPFDNDESDINWDAVLEDIEHRIVVV